MKTVRKLITASSLGAAMLLSAGFASAQQLSMVSGSVGGGYFQAAAAFAEYVQTEMPDVRITVRPGQGWANVDQLDAGTADLAVIENVLATLAWNGDSPSGDKFDFRMLGGVRGPSIVQAFVPVDRGIESFEQIVEEQRGVRIATFERAHIVTPIALDVLAEYGITQEALESWGGQLIFTSLNEAFRMIGDGVVDMWISGGSAYPSHNAVELGVRTPFRLLPLSDEVANSVAAKYGMGLYDVPEGVYDEHNGQNAAYLSPSLIVAFAVRTDLDEELVYNMMDALWKHRDAFLAVHPTHAVFDIVSARENAGGAPLHPGAERWYADNE